MAIKSSAELGIVNIMPDETRRSQRPAIKPEKLYQLYASDAGSRASVLVQVIAEQEEVWCPFAGDEMEGWFDNNANKSVLPIWPTEEAANDFIQAQNAGWEPVPIPIIDWIDDVLPVLDRQAYLLALFPTGTAEVTLKQPDEVLDMIVYEWGKYAKSIAR